jgi:sugar/nucleoside kinase (ribokinase family)
MLLSNISRSQLEVFCMPVSEAVVAGHVCLDIIPDFNHLPSGKLTELLQPGHLVLTGPATFSTGGPVSNTGLALHRLGIGTRLIAKVGRDPFADIVRRVVSGFDQDLALGLVADPDVNTSYTLILSAPGVDRMFLHCAGANDFFSSADVNYDLVSQARIFHFGYPPVMQKIYAEGGGELVELFRRAKETGVTTSLDMTFPDLNSPGGRADWPAILAKTLPYVDIFLPSFEELLFCLRRKVYDEFARSMPEGRILAGASPELVSGLGRQLLEMGVKIAVIKLGDQGLYLRTAGVNALKGTGRAAPADPAAWANLQLRASCFCVDVVGTTGSGDATIAGFLGGLLRGLGPRATINAAVAVGACNVEAADALGGLRTWEDTLARISAGWLHRPLDLSGEGWTRVLDGVWEKLI